MYAPKPQQQNPIVAQLNRAYLQAVIAAWNNRDLALIESLGLSLELAKKLSHAPYLAVDGLGRFRNPVANFQGDGVMIERLLEHNVNEIFLQNKIDDMIRLGATFEFLSALTGYHHTELSQRARSLGVVVNGSRPTLLSTEEWNQAERTWRKYRALPTLDRWIAIARETGISIRRLHAAFKKYEYLTEDEL